MPHSHAFPSHYQPRCHYYCPLAPNAPQGNFMGPCPNQDCAAHVKSLAAALGLELNPALSLTPSSMCVYLENNKTKAKGKKGKESAGLHSAISAQELAQALGVPADQVLKVYQQQTQSLALLLDAKTWAEDGPLSKLNHCPDCGFPLPRDKADCGGSSLASPCDTRAELVEGFLENPHLAPFVEVFRLTPATCWAIAAYLRARPEETKLNVVPSVSEAKQAGHLGQGSPANPLSDFAPLVGYLAQNQAVSPIVAFVSNLASSTLTSISSVKGQRSPLSP